MRSVKDQSRVRELEDSLVQLRTELSAMADQVGALLGCVLNAHTLFRWFALNYRALCMSALLVAILLSFVALLPSFPSPTHSHTLPLPAAARGAALPAGVTQRAPRRRSS